MLARITVPLLVAFLAGSSTQAQTYSATQAGPANWQQFDDALSRAADSGKKVLVDVYAPWCGWCSRLQQDVYTNDEVLSYLEENFEVTRLNVDSRTDTLSFKGLQLASVDLAYGLGAEGTPTTVFLKADGDYITRLPGYVDPNEFLNVLKFIGSDAFESTTFEHFKKNP